MEYCYCESSLCDHPGESCDRPADERFCVDYVTRMCTQCVANMGATGGQGYVVLDPEFTEERV